MKRLTIMRHAKSSWDDPKLGDFDRPLNPRGRKAARRVGNELKRRKIKFDFGLASPAARVRETIDGFIEGYGQPDFEIRFEPKIYEASVSTLLELVRGLPEAVSSAFLIGHNPGLERLLVDLAQDGECRDLVAEKFPTAALARLELPVQHWKDVQPGSAKIAELMVPKKLG